MRQARLYNTPQEFAEMMIQHLRETLHIPVEQNQEEPLLLELCLDSKDSTDKGTERVQISLHSTLDTYMAGGDLNIAIDYLNNIIKCTTSLRANNDICKLDPLYIYPVVRDVRYIEEAAQGSPLVSEEYLPGLGIMFLEIKNSYSKIINLAMLEQNPRLTAERVKLLGFRNLVREGWREPNMVLQVPTRRSCYVEVFMDETYPSACQFLHPQLSRTRIPDSCLLAFTNRQTTLLLRSAESMKTIEEASYVARKSRFKAVVDRNYHLMAHPNSKQIYWIHHGVAALL